MLNAAHEGYLYQDILSAYFVAREIASGNNETGFVFDTKKTPKGIEDKFDDLTIERNGVKSFIQIKYSNDTNQRVLTKSNFSTESNDLFLGTLFESWKALHNSVNKFYVLLAWNLPEPQDEINDVLKLSKENTIVPNTNCYKFDIDALWPSKGSVLSKWKSLSSFAKTIKRNEFQKFLDSLIIIPNLPKSSLKSDYSAGLDLLLYECVKNIGIGVYPNDHLHIENVIDSLRVFVSEKRAQSDLLPVSAKYIAQNAKINLNFGGIEEQFPIDEKVLVDISERKNSVIKSLDENQKVVLVGSPGSGKSWLIHCIEDYCKDQNYNVVKHYCYTDVNDPITSKRVTTNAMFGSLMQKLAVGTSRIFTYASNLDNFNAVLKQQTQKTLIIIDGIDHIWRVYQKNREQLTEKETDILGAITQFDFSNPNIHVLAVSQPISQLDLLQDFTRIDIPSINEDFVAQLLQKNGVENFECSTETLSSAIYKKSGGNALYCKYLTELAKDYGCSTTFSWLKSLPAYNGSLNDYYNYLLCALRKNEATCRILCGSNFSLFADSLKAITGDGNVVDETLQILKPVLKFKPAYGYSIYHESFKRFIIDNLKSQEVDVNRVVYTPIIKWLQNQNFFESRKSYTQLLKLYYEIGDYESINKTISIDFVKESLYYAHSIESIKENLLLQKESQRYVGNFKNLVILKEQDKILQELDTIDSDVDLLQSYLEAATEFSSKEAADNFLYSEGECTVNTENLYRLYAERTLRGNADVHWNLIPSSIEINKNLVFSYVVELCERRDYERIDEFSEKLLADKGEDICSVLDAVKWWYIYHDENVVDMIPSLQNLLLKIKSRTPNLPDLITNVIQKKFHYGRVESEIFFLKLCCAIRNATDKDVIASIAILEGFNWFRNWIIFVIKIDSLKDDEYISQKIIDAFEYLVKDLEPFKGEPRICDLYYLYENIRFSIYYGLSLCEKDAVTLEKCLSIVRRLTRTQTGLQNSFNGPLTESESLDLLQRFKSLDSILDINKQMYDESRGDGYYHDKAVVNFKYAKTLSQLGQKEKAIDIYNEGIRLLTAYGFRKDATLSEVLECSPNIHDKYKRLEFEFWDDLYKKSFAVVRHTDGRGTNDYPCQVFEKHFICNPKEACCLLIEETVSSESVNGFCEINLQMALENNEKFFSPTQWYLLCKTLPLLNSERIAYKSFEYLNVIDEELKSGYEEWQKRIPFVHKGSYDDKFKTNIQDLYKKKLNIELPEDKVYPTYSESDGEKWLKYKTFEAETVKDTLAFFEEWNIHPDDYHKFVEILQISSLNDMRDMLIAYFNSNHLGMRFKDDLVELLDGNSRCWIVYCICAFVYQGSSSSFLKNTEFLHKAYRFDAKAALDDLKYVLAQYILDRPYTYFMTCNLIKAMGELDIPVDEVLPLFDAIRKIVEQRIPPEKENVDCFFINENLEKFSNDEVFVTLLIARFKTLTIEKSQAIIFALYHTLQKNKASFINPLVWILTKKNGLLPIHRALLLQLYVEFFGMENVPHELKIALNQIYPSEYYFENCLLKLLLKPSLYVPNFSQNIVYQRSAGDLKFLKYFNPKYAEASNFVNIHSGCHKSFTVKMQGINKFLNDHYALQYEKMMIPTVIQSNFVYEIVNREHKENLDLMGDSFAEMLQFCMDEIVRSIGSLSLRPEKLPLASKSRISMEFPYNNIQNYKIGDWIVVAFDESEYFDKNKENSNYYHTFISLISEKHLSALDIYRVEDFFEHVNIMFLAPEVLDSLKWSFNEDLQNGLFAKNQDGEIVAKMISWKQNYYGSVESGLEKPGIEGVALLVKQDQLKQLIPFFGDDFGKQLIKKTEL